MRKAHYWKSPIGKELPRRILCFDCETLPHPVVTEDWHPPKSIPAELHKLRLAVVKYGEIRNGRYKLGNEWWIKTSDELKEIIREHTRTKDRLWCIGHNIGFDIGAATLWDWLFSDAFEWKRCILERGKFLMDGWFDGKPITFTDTGNYTLASLESIGKDLGYSKLSMPDFAAPDDDWYVYCQRDVDITNRYFTDLVLWVDKENYGPFAPTAASLAFSTFRKRFMTEKVLVHDHKLALKLERASYYGGLTETPFIGQVKDSPIYEVDVQSMYPFACLNDLPVRFVAYYDKPPVARLRSLMQNYMCFADVELVTQDYTYPVRGKQRVYHPVGTYRTVLPNPELQYAMQSDQIIRVYAASIHERSPLFKSFMEHFYRYKSEYKKQGKEAYSTFSKLQMNSLYGKTGQTSQRWMQWGKESLQIIEAYYGLETGRLSYLYDKPNSPQSPHWPYCIPELGIVIYTRDFGAGVEINIGEGESRDSVPSIAACVTSYARLRLRDLQSIAGYGNWFYSDTDSLWVNCHGLRRLQNAGEIQPGILGKLGQPTAYKGLIVYAPKDYVPIPYPQDLLSRWIGIDPSAKLAVDANPRTKGIRKTAVPNADGSFTQLKFPGPLLQLFGDARDGVIVEYATKYLTRYCRKYHVLPNGATKPFRLPDDVEHIK